MANSNFQLKPSTDLSQTTLGQDINTFKRGQSMFFVLADKTQLEFKFNPVDVQEQSDPIEAAFPTKAGYYVFRWMLEPRKWTIKGYAGSQGRDLEAMLTKLEGQSNVTWICPYVKNAGGRVRIISIQRPKTNKAPFSIYYSISMQNLETTVFGNLGQIIPNRITPAFVSPSIAILYGNINTRGFIPVDLHWHGLSDAALAIRNQGLSTLSYDDIYQSLIQLNPKTPEQWDSAELEAILTTQAQLQYAKS